MHRAVIIFAGQFGNALDAKAAKSFLADDADDVNSDDDDDDADGASRLLKRKREEEANLPCHSTTRPQTPSVMQEKNYLFMNYGGEKPCVYLVAMMEDLRKRMYHSNLLERIVDLIVSPAM